MSRISRNIALRTAKQIVTTEDPDGVLQVVYGDHSKYTEASTPVFVDVGGSGSDYSMDDVTTKAGALNEKITVLYKGATWQVDGSDPARHGTAYTDTQFEDSRFKMMINGGDKPPAINDKFEFWTRKMGRVPCQLYDRSNFKYHVSEGQIKSIDYVLYNGTGIVPSSDIAGTYTGTRDQWGTWMAVVKLSTSYYGTPISVCCKGRMDSGGTLLDTHRGVIEDFLKSYASFGTGNFETDQATEFQFWADRFGMKFSGVIDEIKPAAAYLDEIFSEINGHWSISGEGKFRPHIWAGTFLNSQYHFRESDDAFSEGPTWRMGAAEDSNIVNRLNVSYRWNWVEKKALASAIYHGTQSQQIYGTYEENLDVKWLDHTSNIGTLATLRLTRRAEPIWHVSFGANQPLYFFDAGDVVEITHGAGPGTLGWMQRKIQLSSVTKDMMNRSVTLAGWEIPQLGDFSTAFVPSPVYNGEYNHDGEIFFS